MLKYYPEDDQQSGTLGILLPMNNGGDSIRGGFFNMSRTTEEQAISNYINLLLTFPGERYMQPDFGIGIQRRLFEPNTEGLRLSIEADIDRQSAFWLPYINNHSIEVRERVDIPGMKATDSENAIQIIITFSVTEDGANHQLVIFETGGRTNIQLN